MLEASNTAFAGSKHTTEFEPKLLSHVASLLFASISYGIGLPPGNTFPFPPSIIWSVLAKVQDITLAYLDVPVEARPCVGGSNTATVLVLGSNRAANRPARRIAIYYPFVLTPFAF